MGRPEDMTTTLEKPRNSKTVAKEANHNALTTFEISKSKFDGLKSPVKLFILKVWIKRYITDKFDVSLQDGMYVFKTDNVSDIVGIIALTNQVVDFNFPKRSYWQDINGA